MIDGSAGRTRRPPGAGLLRLYPRSWRDRYEAEVVAVLELAHVGRRERVDLVRGALDARLHAPSRIPGVAALICGGLWTFIGAGVIAQPVPPDWPGYLAETLPLAFVAVVAGAAAAVGFWGRRSDAAGRRGTIAMVVGLVAQAVWAVTLLVSVAGTVGLPELGVAQAVGALGVLLVGLVILAAGDLPVGGLLVLAPTWMLFGWPIAWLGYGLAWTMAGAIVLMRPAGDEPRLRSTG
ncbi:MAG TPA: hypothetical protein VFO05_02045 [Candidatus Limnocylindrales bacterium]|nr:hypothetical protein [Candidatus Limnocylindrales bacterium]